MGRHWLSEEMGIQMTDCEHLSASIQAYSKRKYARGLGQVIKNMFDTLTKIKDENGKMIVIFNKNFAKILRNQGLRQKRNLQNSQK